MSLAKYLSPKNDIAFKKIFGQEKNKDILMAFANDALGNKEGDMITDVKFIDPKLPPKIKLLKESSVDVMCTDQKGNHYIVEMQYQKQDFFDKRLQFYAAQAYVGQLGASTGYEVLKEVKTIAVTNFHMPGFDNRGRYLSRHSFQDEETGENYFKDLRLVLIDLARFAELGKKIDELESYTDKMCYFFNHAHNEDEIANLSGLDPTIERACDEIASVNWTKKELQQYEAFVKVERDHINVLKTARREGREEGREAREIEIAKGLLKSGVDLNIIADNTGLTIEKIKKFA